MAGLSHLGCGNRNQRLGADKQEEFISHGSEDWEDQAKQLVEATSNENWLLAGRQLPSRCVLVAEDSRELSGAPQGMRPIRERSAHASKGPTS